MYLGSSRHAALVLLEFMAPAYEGHKFAWALACVGKAWVSDPSQTQFFMQGMLNNHA
jgi:hypothetical protein